MEPIIITIQDKNVVHSLDSFTINHRIASQSTSVVNSRITFPTNIKYIFQDDNYEDAELMKSNEDVDNLVIVQLDELGILENVEIVSDNFGLLDYSGWSQHAIKSARQQLSAIVDGTQDVTSPLKSIELATEQKSVCDIDIDVVTEFQDVLHTAPNLELNELIQLYEIQNEQLKKLIDHL